MHESGRNRWGGQSCGNDGGMAYDITMKIKARIPEGFLAKFACSELVRTSYVLILKTTCMQIGILRICLFNISFVICMQAQPDIFRLVKYSCCTLSLSLANLRCHYGIRNPEGIFC